MDIILTDHSSLVSGQPLHEVFLSYRGPDMRRGFADFLHAMLTDVGISVFKDEEELESGKEINPQLIQAIEQSSLSIPVISKEYASSKSCLMELEQMVECMDNKNRIIIPIFYYIDPSDVCNCRGPFERALDEHKKSNTDDSFCNRWMSALRRIGDLEGHHLHEKSAVSHGEVVKKIVHQVQQKLKKQELIVPKQLVVVDSHVQGLMAKLKVDYRNGQAVEIADTSVTVVGIFGIPGVGKTVLAKYVYNQLYHLFHACTFLGEIQSKIKHHDDILSLQIKLISDLHKGNAGKFYSSEEALHHIQENFRTMKVLLFLDDVKDDGQLGTLVGKLDWLGPGSRVILTSQTQDVLGKINGAESFVLEPLKQDEALKLFCRHAFGTDSPREEFEELSMDIVAATDRLPLALEVTGSSLFLVKSKKHWRETLAALKVSLHKRVQVVEDFKKRFDILGENQQKIFIDIACLFTGMDKRKPYYVSDDCKYSPSRRIPALHARSLVKIGEDESLLMHDILRKFGREIVENESRYEPSKRSRLWDPEDVIPVPKSKEAEKLKVLNLSYCRKLTAIPQLPPAMKLEMLNLEGCSNLAVIHPSVGNIDNLVYLNMRECSFLCELPDLSGTSISQISFQKDSMKKLEIFSARNCKNLTEMSDSIVDLESLTYLALDGTSIHTLPGSIGLLKRLNTLSLRNCRRLSNLPDGIGNLKSLQSLELSHTAIQELPPSVKDLKSMKVLRMRDTLIREFPEAILNLEKLEEIDFSLCPILEGGIPDDISRLSSLAILKLTCTGISGLPPSFHRLSHLRELDISGCDNLQSLPELPSSLINVLRDLGN